MKRRPRQSWATRPLPPVTVAEIERHLDLVARLMDGAGKDAELYLPIWRRCQRELAARKDVETQLAEARQRLRRSSDRTEARSA